MRSRFFVLLSFFFLLGCNHPVDAGANETQHIGYVVSLSIASDGKHVISAQSDQHIILWDIQSQKNKSISEKGNIFSAYFIKHSDRFLWQDIDNTIFVQDTDGRIIHSFPLFPTYGHVMTTDLENYFSSDSGWGLYSGYGASKKILKAADDGSFTGHGKLLNLVVNEKTHALLSTGYVYDWEHSGSSEKQRRYAEKLSYEGIVLWDINTNKLLTRLPGNAAKTYATISPDGRFVVSGDENGICFVWDIKENKIAHYLASLHHGRIINPKDPYEKWKRDKTGLIPPPKDFTGGSTISINFINNDYYLRIFYDEHYVALYQIDNDMPVKYLDLGDTPYPSVKEYYRNVSIDTAPDTGILVTGQYRGSGINVYQFDPENLTLDKIWVTQ